MGEIDNMRFRGAGRRITASTTQKLTEKNRFEIKDRFLLFKHKSFSSIRMGQKKIYGN
jgi:hypothetical protein